MWSSLALLKIYRRVSALKNSNNIVQSNLGKDNIVTPHSSEGTRLQRALDAQRPLQTSAGTQPQVYANATASIHSHCSRLHLQ